MHAADAAGSNTPIPLPTATIIVAATVVAPHPPDAIASPRCGRETLRTEPSGAVAAGSRKSRDRPTSGRPSAERDRRRTAPAAARPPRGVATSTFCGYGSPWLMRVDSRATTGVPRRQVGDLGGDGQAVGGILTEGTRVRDGVGIGRATHQLARGVDRWRRAGRLPATAPRWRAADGATPPPPSVQPRRARNPALNASPAPVVSAARIDDVATSNGSTRLPSRVEDRAPLRQP